MHGAHAKPNVSKNVQGIYIAKRGFGSRGLFVIPCVLLEN